MSDISSYPTATPTGSDLILGSQKDDSNIFHTKNFTAQSIANLGSGGGGGNQDLQSVLTAGNRYTSSDNASFILNELTNNNGNISYTNQIGRAHV